jgi:hypothetical protein
MIKLYLCLIKHYGINMYEEMELQLQWIEVSNQIYVPSALFSGVL